MSRPSPGVLPSAGRQRLDGAMDLHHHMRGHAGRRCSSWMLLLLVAGNALLLPPALASRQGRQSAHIAAAATAASVQDSGSSLDAWPRRHVHSPFNSEASMQIAARQRLFDYAVTEALEILGVAVEKVRIPEYRTTLEIPVIGGIDVVISNVNITDLQVQSCTKLCGAAQHHKLSSWVEAAEATDNCGIALGSINGASLLSIWLHKQC